jgi:hypothetical protein
MPVPVSLDLIEIALFRNSGGKPAAMVWRSRPVARALNTGAVFDMSGFCRDIDETRISWLDIPAEKSLLDPLPTTERT